MEEQAYNEIITRTEITDNLGNITGYENTVKTLPLAVPVVIGQMVLVMIIIFAFIRKRR